MEEETVADIHFFNRMGGARESDHYEKKKTKTKHGKKEAGYTISAQIGVVTQQKENQKRDQRSNEKKRSPEKNTKHDRSRTKVWKGSHNERDRSAVSSLAPTEQGKRMSYP